MTPLHLLIIEDSEDDAILIISRLRRDGVPLTFERVETADAMTAVLSTHPPDVIISDYNMPAFSADAALALLAEIELDVPFILVSGEIGEETAAALMRAGAHDFFLKDRLARLTPAVQRELREAADRRERRRAQVALRASEERFRLLAEHAQDIIFRYRLTPQPHLDYISPAVTTITGHSPDELYFDPELVFSAVEDGPRLKASWQSAEPEPLLVCWRRPDGQAAWTEQRAVGVRDTSGALAAVEGILRDVTERILAERERTRLEQQLRQTERLESLGQLAGGVAHDFNNLLAAISGYTELMRPQLPADGELRRDLDGIAQAATSGAALIRQLLIFSRQQPSQPQTVDLNARIVETERLLCRTVGDNIHLRTCPEAAPSFVIIDPGKLDQIIVNLAVNARDAMPNGGQLTISTANLDTPAPPCTATPPHERHVRLTVADTGTGMPPHVAARVFDPFFTTKPLGEGTGLGLATVYGIIREAGGHIELTSEPGKGTIFHIDLPAANAPTIPAAAPPPGPAGATGAGQTILVVEDQDQVRETISRILTRATYHVLQAATPAQALDITSRSSTHLDALLTDAVMPGISGIQLIEQIRQIRPGIPAILMSGYSAASLPGSQDPPPDIPLIHKPFTAETILRHIQDALRPHTADERDDQGGDRRDRGRKDHRKDAS